MKNIHFFTEDADYTVKQKMAIRQWIVTALADEGFRLGELNLILCSDAYLLEMNKQYLDHNTLTDIITFDNSEEDGKIIGDIFISVERVLENAKKFGVTEADELHRVMIHGVMHLCGYGDKGKEAKAKMTEKEDSYLSKRVFV